VRLCCSRLKGRASLNHDEKKKKEANINIAAAVAHGRLRAFRDASWRRSLNSIDSTVTVMGEKGGSETKPSTAQWPCLLLGNRTVSFENTPPILPTCRHGRIRIGVLILGDDRSTLCCAVPCGMESNGKKRDFRIDIWHCRSFPMNSISPTALP
jgi:hypothetical protein